MLPGIISSSQDFSGNISAIGQSLPVLALDLTAKVLAIHDKLIE